ncbi:hypothetical protein AALO_G00188790 [Alosa alosa]|uniref:Uncharacterized protein n=1 Tax=Alosa alosa TaxID=278164 RepID=A0AAV6G579_9TELE|nr:uncharacterized protein C16orf46 [Alosa alosa]KAG5270105.1 hypothetical protein AALO_G00188790 [Alosa alosa]
MESFRGFESACEYGDNNGCMSMDTYMEEHQLSDRDLVNTLLDVSEEYLSNDQDTDGFRNHNGWEEAVHGWGRGPSLQMQRRSKRPKTWDADSHCLLCVDTKVVEPHVSETARHSPELCSRSSPKNSKKTIPPNIELLKARPSSTCSVSSAYKNTLDLLPKQAVSAKKFSGISGLLINRTAASCVGLSHHQEDQCLMLKDQHAGNATLVNCNAVLPPLKTSLDGNASCPNHLESGEVSFGADIQDTAEIWWRGASATATAGGSRGVDGCREMRTAAHLDSRSAEDGLHSSDASKYWTCENSHSLLTAFSIPITKRSDQSFPTMNDAMPRVTYRLARYPRQEDLARSPARNNGGKLYFGYKTKNIRRAEPKLPMLFGTRVAIPASTHRL